MKIVVNKCYGGFGLSPAAEKRYLELIGKECYFYTEEKIGNHEYIQISVEEAAKAFITFTYTKDLGKEFTEWPKDDSSYFSDRDIPRDDQFLVQVVEEMGEAANGRHADLQITEIPDGIDWQIGEYDGTEWVEEKHRTW